MHRWSLATLFLLLASSARAQSIDFDVPFQPVDDLMLSGVTFDFKVDGMDSGEAFVGSYGPGILNAVSDPSLTGDSTGILTLTFDFPTPTLAFGIALSTADSLSPGFEVELFSADHQSVFQRAVDTVAVGGPIAFSEAQFTYEGLAVSKAVINFADSPGNFAFDNLVYQIPEPAAYTLLGCGLASWPVWRRRRASEGAGGSVR